MPLGFLMFESDIDRKDVFRLNFAISRQTFIRMFADVPKRPEKGTCIEGQYDFTALDRLTPHPVYGWMTWVSIVNPSETTWKNMIPLLDESYERSCKRYATLLKKGSMSNKKQT